jgi:hypothetical protein
MNPGTMRAAGACVLPSSSVTRALQQPCGWSGRST